MTKSVAKFHLESLVKDQNCKCHYCAVQMTFKTECKFKDTDATVEHLIDKWSSPKHIKSDVRSNIVAACFKCNNTRGNARNRIARSYYQGVINKKNLGIKAANISSKDLYKRFGAIPQELFKTVV
jgi:hypothetical protein